jgi:hypothetical protein
LNRLDNERHQAGARKTRGARSASGLYPAQGLGLTIAIETAADRIHRFRRLPKGRELHVGEAKFVDSHDGASVSMPTDSHWRAFGKVYRIAGCMPLNGTYCGAVADIEPTNAAGEPTPGGCLYVRIGQPALRPDRNRPASNVEVSGSSLKFLAMSPSNTSCIFRGFFRATRCAERITVRR